MAPKAQPPKAQQQPQQQAKPTQAITLQHKVNTLATAITARKGSFATAAAKHFNVDRMIKLAQASLSRTPKLAECTQESVLVTLMRCAELGLEPNSPLGGMHLVPYLNRKAGKMECQGIIDYRGLVDLARRSGELVSIFAEPRYEKDKWKRTLGTTPKIEHEPADDEERGQLLGFYAVGVLKSGEVQFTYMTLADVNAIKARSRASESGPWQTDFVEMGKKTVLRRLAKLLPMSSAAKDQIAIEDAIEAGGEVPGVAIDVPMIGDGQQGGGDGDGAPSGTVAEVERALAGADAGEAKKADAPGKDEPGSDG